MPISSVSVIVPAYNYAHYLRGCVSSVLGQEGVDVSVLIIDDCSTDDTSALGQRLAEEDPRVEYRRHEDNQGHIATYNEGFEWAAGDYTVLLSADDELTPGSLARAAGLMDRRPDVGFVYGRTVFLRSDEPSEHPRTESRRSTVWPGPRWLELRCRATTNCISSPEVVVRTSLLKRLGGFRPELPHSGDLEFWMRCSVHASVGYIRDAHQAVYRIHPNSMLRTKYLEPIVDLRQRKAAFDLLFREQRAFIPDVDRLQTMANRSLAREALWSACRAYDRRRAEWAPVAELVEFAHQAFPEASSLREFTGLRWRRRVGTRVCPYLQPVLVVPVLRRLRNEWAWRSVQRRGV